jgi:hypothetical protein
MANPVLRDSWVDLVHAVEWRARAYEERCESSFGEYTLTDRITQAARPIRPTMSCVGVAGRLLSGAMKPLEGVL